MSSIYAPCAQKSSVLQFTSTDISYDCGNIRILSVYYASSVQPRKPGPSNASPTNIISQILLYYRRGILEVIYKPRDWVQLSVSEAACLRLVSLYTDN